MSPAPAGMIPVWNGIVQAAQCEPRTRGDDPYIGKINGTTEG